MYHKISNKNSIKLACEILEKGELIIYPTDTLYGFGVDATNTLALKKLNKIKRREQVYSIIVNSKNMLNDYAEFSCMVEKKIDSLLPGPFTLILNRKKSNLSKLVYLDLSTIGVRIPNHNFPLEMVKVFKKPIITTSVNVHNQKSLNNFEEIKKQFKNIDIFIDEKLKYNSKGSTIIDCTSEDFSILRMGDGVFK